MNFPGPMQYATTNYKELSDLLEEYSAKLGKNYLKPSDFLKTGKFVEMQ